MNTITTATSKDNLLSEIFMALELDKKPHKMWGLTLVTPNKAELAKRPQGKGWVYAEDELGSRIWMRIRKLTPRECGRLMDVDEPYLDKMLSAGISDSQLYKCFGNSIVVACMEGIFYNLFSDEEVEQTGQLSLF